MCWESFSLGSIENFEASSFRPTPLWETHHILTQKLKVMGEWVISLINIQVFTFPTNVELLPTLLTLVRFSTQLKLVKRRIISGDHNLVCAMIFEEEETIVHYNNGVEEGVWADGCSMEHIFNRYLTLSGIQKTVERKCPKKLEEHYLITYLLVLMVE